MNRSDIKLIHSYLDETLSEDEQRRLNDRIKDDAELRDLFVNLTLLHNQLQNEYAAKNNLVIQNESSPIPSQLTDGSLNRFRQITAWGPIVFAAICMLLIISIGLLFLQTEPQVHNDPLVKNKQSVEIGTLLEIKGDAYVVSENSITKNVMNGDKIYSGDTLQTKGVRSSLVMQYHDGTRLLLVSNAIAKCEVDDGQKKAIVKQGLVSASVNPQPAGHPMLMITEKAKIEVLGTKFLLHATSAQTDIDVSHGKVKLTRFSDNHSVALSSGKRTSAREGEEIQIADIPQLPNVWEEGFENGLGKKQFGIFTQTKLPAGSQGAAKAKYTSNYDGRYQIVLTSSDIQGFSAITDNTHLHFTFKLTKKLPEGSNWLNAFVLTRSTVSGNSHYQHFKSTDISDHLPKIQQWRTITIPLVRFQRSSINDEITAKRWTGGSPTTNETIYSIWVSSPPPDRGLVIDKLWITSDGPGEVVVKDIQ